MHSGKSGTIREWNQASGVRKAHYYVRKSSILFAGKAVRKISFIACELSPSKIHLSDYPKSLNSRIISLCIFLGHRLLRVLLSPGGNFVD